MKRRVWLIYDLGFDGDYTRLYDWLDNIKAKECVVGGATFEWDFQTEDRDEIFNELMDAIPVDLEENPSARIYAITRVKENVLGRFLIGKRKTAPWFGNSHREADDEDV